jgi:hypothetical protein
MKENLDQLIEKRRIELMKAADRYFPQISAGTTNGNLLIKTIEEKEASSFIVQRLEDIESSGDIFWNDKVLFKWFEDKKDSSVFIIPKDPVEKIRWQALVCIAASITEGFSYGNVVIPPDCLPEESEEFWDYEKQYGTAVLENIIDLRKQLRLR